MPDLDEVLKGLDFGSRTAEEEITGLSRYFVETMQWSRIRSGEKDIVYGPKGAGKSAIYAVMVERSGDFSREGIVIKGAERPQGETAFSEIARDPPAGEELWRLLWRAYFVCLVAEVLEEEQIRVPAARAVLDSLVENGLRSGRGVKAALQAAREFIGRLQRAKSIESDVGVDPQTGALRVGGKIELEPAAREAIEAASAVSGLLDMANQALADAGLEVWIVLDRLDVAFSDPLVETPALRALMRVYLDFTTFEQITPKIFMRPDIWGGLSAETGFREASHITRNETITWNRDNLLNLVIRRALENEKLCEWFDLDGNAVLEDATKQEELFERMFENAGGGHGGFPTMLDWAIGALSDGFGRSAPREIIHLLSVLKDRQIERLMVGRPGPAGKALFEPDILAPALKEVSDTYLAQTLYAEHPKYQSHVEALRGGPLEHSLESLEALWRDTADTTRAVVDGLVTLGVLSRRPGADAGFEVAMLYRPALELLEQAPGSGEVKADG